MYPLVSAFSHSFVTEKFIKNSRSMRVLNTPHLHQHLVLSIFLILAILLGVCRYLIAILVCILLMHSEVKHLLICLLATWISSPCLRLDQFNADFLLGHLVVDFFSSLICRVFSMLWLRVPIEYVYFKYFPTCCLHFHTLDGPFWETQVLKFNKDPFNNLSYYGSCCIFLRKYWLALRS